MQQLSRTQQGFSLISLMLGATLSLLSIIAMMTLYKNLVTNAIVATEDAQQDGQVASARLTIQRGLQAAGYGIENATTGNSNALELRSDAQLSVNLTTFASMGNSVSIPGDTAGNLLFWRDKDGSSSYCHGVMSNAGGLYELSVDSASCTGSFTGQTWTIRPVITPTHSLDAMGADLTRSQAVSASAFTVKKAACWPYGRNADSTLTDNGFLQVSLSSTVTLNKSTETTVCLTNFSVSLP